MKIYKFEYKKAQMKLYFVLIIVSLLSVTLFINIDKRIMMSIVYLVAALYTFLNVTKYIKNSKKNINSIIVDDKSVMINFMHVMVDPIKLNIDELYAIEEVDKLNIKQVNGDIFVATVYKENSIDKHEWEELLKCFRN